jgi:hypothetical protein
MANKYTFFDPNLGATRTVGEQFGGVRHAINSDSGCSGGLSIRIYNSAGAQVYYSCYGFATLKINDQGAIDPNIPCDCVNGGCVSATLYNTPGVFANLAACQSGCAKNSNCTGECVDPAEIAALNQSISTLRSRICH